MEVGEGKLNKEKKMSQMGKKKWKEEYVKKQRSKKDGRYGENKKRIKNYYKYKVIIKKQKKKIKDIYMG